MLFDSIHYQGWTSSKQLSHFRSSLLSRHLSRVAYVGKVTVRVENNHVIVTIIVLVVRCKKRGTIYTLGRYDTYQFETLVVVSEWPSPTELLFPPVCLLHWRHSLKYVQSSEGPEAEWGEGWLCHCSKANGCVQLNWRGTTECLQFDQRSFCCPLLTSWLMWRHCCCGKQL